MINTGMSNFSSLQPHQTSLQTLAGHSVAKWLQNINVASLFYTYLHLEGSDLNLRMCGAVQTDGGA